MYFLSCFCSVKYWFQSIDSTDIFSFCLFSLELVILMYFCRLFRDLLNRPQHQLHQPAVYYALSREFCLLKNLVVILGLLDQPVITLALLFTVVCVYKENSAWWMYVTWWAQKCENFVHQMVMELLTSNLLWIHLCMKHL